MEFKAEALDSSVPQIEVTLAGTLNPPYNIRLNRQLMALTPARGNQKNLF
jgi:hypothetical protein